MKLLDYLKGKSQKETAKVAKDRLQILLARERSDMSAPDYFPQMKEEIIAVIRKYVEVDNNALQLSIDENNGVEVLELNVTLN